MAMQVRAYRKKDINDIHNAKDNVPYFSHVVRVTCEDQCASHDMMRKHLVIIFSALLDIQDEYLL